MGINTWLIKKNNDFQKQFNFKNMKKTNLFLTILALCFSTALLTLSCKKENKDFNFDSNILVAQSEFLKSLDNQLSKASIKGVSDTSYLNLTVKNPYNEFGVNFKEVVLGMMLTDYSEDTIFNQISHEFYNQMNSRGYGGELIDPNTIVLILTYFMNNEERDINYLYELYFQNVNTTILVKEILFLIQSHLLKSTSIDMSFEIICLAEAFIYSSNQISQNDKNEIFKGLEIGRRIFQIYYANYNKASWKDCASFAIGFGSAILGGPGGAIIGIGSMILSAGSCEAYLRSRGIKL